MMMMEPPSQSGEAFNWGPAEVDIGEHSLLWLTEAVDNSLMAGAHLQMVAEPPPAELVAQAVSFPGSDHVAAAGHALPPPAGLLSQEYAALPLQPQQPSSDFSDASKRDDGLAWSFGDGSAPPASSSAHQQPPPAPQSFEHVSAPLVQPATGAVDQQPQARSKPKQRRPPAAVIPSAHTPSPASNAGPSAQAPVTPPTRQQPRASSAPSSSSAVSVSGGKKRSASSESGKARRPAPPTITMAAPPTCSSSSSSSSSLPKAMAGPPARKSSGRIDVRFIPQDPATADQVKSAGYHPKLELKTPSSKCVGFFVSHLTNKWSRVACIDKIQLRLCPPVAGGVSGTRSSPDGKLPVVSGPSLSVDASLSSLSAHFDLVVNKERPILFLAYALPHPPPSTRGGGGKGESSAWACEDLSNLLCHSASMDDHHHQPPPPTFALSAEDASLLRAMPDMSFSMPADSAHPPATPATSSFNWQSELGSLRASGSGSDCKAAGGVDILCSPKKRPFYAGNNEMPDGQAQQQQQHSYEHFQPAPPAQYQQQHPASYHVPSSGQDAAQQQSEGRKGSDKKRRRIAPVLVSAAVAAPAPPQQQDPCRDQENFSQQQRPSF